VEGQGDDGEDGGAGSLRGNRDPKAVGRDAGKFNLCVLYVLLSTPLTDIFRSQDFLESVESLILTTPANPTSIASRPSSSRRTARHSLAKSTEAKDIRKNIDILRKRIAKHFGNADEEQISRNLIGFVEKECERSCERVIERLEKVIELVYPPSAEEKVVEVGFSREDIRAGFRR